MEKKYQVFVSSTYEDLQDERKEVIQALLESSCIPVGMELFPASNENQWNFIKNIIKDCDYYVLIVGGRYGSIHPQKGISYTHMEYNYAIEEGIPVIAFLHADIKSIPSGKTEYNDEGKAKLNSFLTEVKNTRLCKYWKNPDDLAGKISRSIQELIKSCPRTGWIKADSISSSTDKKDNGSILREDKVLKGELEKLLRKQAPLDSFLKDSYMCNVNGFDETEGKSVTLNIYISWGEILKTIYNLNQNNNDDTSIEIFLEKEIKQKMIGGGGYMIYEYDIPIYLLKHTLIERKFLENKEGWILSKYGIEELDKMNNR